MSGAGIPSVWNMIVWGFVATLGMSTVLQGAQGLGIIPPEPAIFGRHDFHSRSAQGRNRWVRIVCDGRLGFCLAVFPAVSEFGHLHLVARNSAPVFCTASFFW